MAQKPETRKFRHAVSVLKKQGLIPASIDARSAIPSKTVRGKSLSTLVRKYDDVLSGKQTALTVPPSKLKAYRKAGFSTTQNSKILVPHSATEKARLNRAGEVSIKSKAGIERVQIPVPYHRLSQYLKDIARDHKRIDAMKRKNEYFGFRFFGNNTNLYSDILSAIESISKYATILNTKSRAKQQEIYQNLEIVTVGNPAKWTFPGERRAKDKAEYRRKRLRKFRKNLKHKSLSKQEAYRADNAERQKAYREKLKRSPRKLKQYKDAGKKRAAKSKKKATNKNAQKRKTKNRRT